MGGYMTGYINDTDVFVRTVLGSKELASRRNAVIPREARTLLIFIDGQKSYEQVAKPLESRNLYKSGGGVRPFMQMLVDLEYVVCKSTATVIGKTVALSETAALSALNARSSEHVTHQERAVVEKADPVVDFQQVRESLSDTPDNHTRISSSATESLRDIISSLITKHAEAVSAYTYNKRLSQCQGMRSIFELIQDMQRASSGEFEMALYLTALAFKKSKVTKSQRVALAEN